MKSEAELFTNRISVKSGAAPGTFVLIPHLANVVNKKPQNGTFWHFDFQKNLLLRPSPLSLVKKIIPDTLLFQLFFAPNHGAGFGLKFPQGGGISNF